MTRIQGDFMDSNNIIIKDGVPCYFYSGNSYLEKLKNGVSLDYMFMLEDSIIDITNKPIKNTSTEKKQYQPLKCEMFAEEYDCEPLSRPRKGKKIIKKPSGKNMKKNKIRQNGYDDKLHTIETNLSSIWDPDFDWHSFYSKNDDNYSSDYESYNSDIEYYSRMAFGGNDLIIYSAEYDSLDEWNFANRTGRGWD